jgi:hypothetical protein
MKWFEFRNPETVLERKQKGTCLGCVEPQVSRWGGVRKYVCSKGQQKASLDWIEMRRCNKYEAEVE